MYYGAIVKAKVLNLLAFKLEHWSFILKANFGPRADTHSQFCQKNATLGYGAPSKDVQIQRKISNLKNSSNEVGMKIWNLVFYFILIFFDKKITEKVI